jgi:hypothetical protein
MPLAQCPPAATPQIGSGDKYMYTKSGWTGAWSPPYTTSGKKEQIDQMPK